MKTLTTSLGLLFMLLVAAVPPLAADEKTADKTPPPAVDTKKSIFFNITTDEAWKAGMALGQARNALEHGYKVTIHLNTRAVFIVSQSFTSDINGASGKSLQDMVKALLEGGAQVIICPMCMQKAGMTTDDVIPGVIKGGPDVTLKAMTADHTTVVSY